MTALKDIDVSKLNRLIVASDDNLASAVIGNVEKVLQAQYYSPWELVKRLAEKDVVVTCSGGVTGTWLGSFVESYSKTYFAKSTTELKDLGLELGSWAVS